MWSFSFPNTIFWRDYLFPIDCSWLPRQILVDCICVGLFLGTWFCSIGLCVCFFTKFFVLKVFKKTKSHINVKWFGVLDNVACFQDYMCPISFMYSIFYYIHIQSLIFYSFIVGLIFEVCINSCLIGSIKRLFFYLGHKLGRWKMYWKKGNIRERDRDRDRLTGDQRTDQTMFWGNN